MTAAVLLISLYITLYVGRLEKVSGMESRMAAATAPGDFIIGALFPIHEGVDKSNRSFAPHIQPCTSVGERGLPMALAMINAVEEINKSPLMNDVNITLGYRIMDSCYDVGTALRATADFTEQDDCHEDRCQPVMAVVGSSSSELSIAIARRLTLKMIPQISYSSSAVILSDKSRFPAFVRTIPNDYHQTAAMVSLLSTYNWNWVGILIADGDYGRSALELFLNHASEKGICVAFKTILPWSVTHQDFSSTITKAAKTILQNPKVQVIVSFTRSSHMTYLYQELHNLKAGLNMGSVRRVWVASDGWSTSSSAVGHLSLDDIGHVVGFTFKRGDLTSYMEYLSRLEASGDDYTANNAFLKEFYKQLNDTEGSAALVSAAVNSFRQHTDAGTVFSIEMAVSAIAQALASICQRRDCKTPGSVQPWQVLEAMWMEDFSLRGKRYKFDDKGDINLGYDVTMWRQEDRQIYINDVVAEYHLHNKSFTYTDHNSNTHFKELQSIISKCTDSCPPGQFKKAVPTYQHTCCNECINCTENYYSNDTDVDQCLSCNISTEWSPEGSSTCIPKTLLFFSWQDGFAVVLLVFSALGILLCLLVSALFLHHCDTPVVRAAGGPLSQVILFSLVVSYISATLFVGQPNSLQCKARQVLYGISFTLCVSCILVKTLKILLAFQFNPGLQGLLRRLYQPFVIIGICVALQVSTCVCWLVLKSPSNIITIFPTYLLNDCDEGSYLAFGVMLGYIAVLAFVCFICAFKGRKLPQQYNEAKFITFSMLLYLMSWLLFIPVYVTTTGVYLPAVEMVVILISNYGVLSCHFFPKCYIILLKKEQNTKSAFINGLREYSKTNSISGSSELSQQSSDSSQSVPTATPQTPAVTQPAAQVCTEVQQHNCLRRSTSV